MQVEHERRRARLWERRVEHVRAGLFCVGRRDAIRPGRPIRQKVPTADASRRNMDETES